MFHLVAQVLREANLKPFVRTNDKEILVRDDKNILWKIKIEKVHSA